MRHIIETGTDAATVCFFDPVALPADFDLRVKEEAFEYLDQLSREGRIWAQNTGADGSYLFHFYIDEKIPESIAKFSDNPQTIARFPVPGGTIWACGTEYAAKNPLAAGLEKFSHMGGCSDLAPGEYHVVAWRVEWPEGFVESELEKSLGKNFVRNNKRWGCSTGLLVFLAPALIIFASFKTFLIRNQMQTKYLAGLWLVAVLAAAACALLIRKTNRTEKNPLVREIYRQYPSIAVQMKKLNV